MTLRSLKVLPLMLALLTACGTLRGVNTRPDPPPPPSDLEACFERTVSVPGKPGTPLTKAQTTKLILDLYANDGKKTRCGRRALAYLVNRG